MAYKLKLLEWGLEAYVDKFEEEGIDDISFQFLDEESIRKIFPKCGPRLIFKNRFSSEQERSSSTQSDEIILEPDDELLSLFQEDNSKRVEVETFCPSLIHDIPSSSNLIKVAPSNSNFIRTGPSTSNTILAGPSTSNTVLAGPTTSNPCQIVGESVFPEGLEITLKKSTDGKLVLLNKGHLNNNLRQKLVRCMVNELIRFYGIKINTDIFLRISQEIESVFPNEKAESYFVPYHPPEKKRKLLSIEEANTDQEKDRGVGPKGKLWNKFVNVRHALNTANSSKIRESSVEQDKEYSNYSDEEENYLNFLKVAIEPFPKVLEAWENSVKLRRKLYLNTGLTEIYRDFPCLKLNNGIELIETDFNQKYPDKIDILYNNWPKVFKAILDEAKERKISVTSNIDSEKSLQAILALPYLCPPVMVKKSRKGSNWRPTRSEIQESFFSIYANFEELEQKIESRKKKLKEYGITLQPFAALLENPEGYFVVVDETKYKIASGIRTLELLFKLFHALDIAYPPECEHIWLLVEELLFLMKPSKKLPSTSTAISDIKYHLEKYSN